MSKELTKEVTVLKGDSRIGWDKVIEKADPGIISFPKKGLSKNLYLTFNLDDFNAKKIAEIISFLSDLYHNIGGDQLIIAEAETFKLENANNPVLI